MDLTPGCGSPPGAVSRNARVAHQEPSSDQDPKHGVCPGCGNLNADYFEPPEDERLVTNAPAGATLRVPVVELRNASAHCLACRAIIGLLEDNIEDFDDEELVVIKAYERKLVFELNQYGRPDGRFELYRHSEGLIKTASLKAKVAKELWPAVGTARTLGPSFSISDACCLIAPWMDECKSFHCECTRDEDENPPLPTRLLAVGDENGTAPYLYETQANEIGQYAALSHCWGPPEHLPPRTTRENLGLRRLSIPIEELPPTFSEAVQLCRGLGIPYLWIDSLCIIQDDAADWEREAARMQQVYKNAVLTISADGAVNSRVGLFKPVRDRRLPRSVTTCCPVVAVAESEGAATTERSEPERLCGRRTDLYVGLEHGVFGVHTVGSSSSGDGEPLSRRGWALQEWILSRRIAHFTTGELLWDCLGAEGCECQTQLTSRTSTSDIRRQALPEGHGYWGTIDNAEYWGTMVRNFTARNLTYDSDRLPALSGVAKSSAGERLPNDRYLAGLWKSELPSSLLWERTSSAVDELASNIITHRRIAGYHAPSWSWASIVGPVRFPKVDGRGVELCQILRIWYKLAGSNPYGPFSAGLLIVQGPVAKIPACIPTDLHVNYIEDISLQPGPFTDLYEDIVFLGVRGFWDPRRRLCKWEGLALQAVGDSQDRFTRIGVLSLTHEVPLRNTGSEEVSYEMLRAAIGAEIKMITIV